MPQPTGGGPGYGLPYPASSTAFPPYPTSNFGGFPAYPGGSGASNPPSSGGYPPYPTPNPPNSGYNNFYGGASVIILQLFENSLDFSTKKNYFLYEK